MMKSIRAVTVFMMVIALSMAIAPTHAAKGQSVKEPPLDLLNMGGGGQANTRIEKQTWWINGTTPDPSHITVNPGGYGSWDINDHNDLVAGGYLSPGMSSTGYYRHIWDFNPMYNCYSGTCANWSGTSNWFGIVVQAPSDKLTAKVCFTPQNRCFNLTPVPFGTKAYKYLWCGQVLYRQDDPAIIDIPNSGFGRGVPSEMAITISNPTSRIVHDVYGGWGISSDVNFESGCNRGAGYNPNQEVHASDYPFFWIP